MKVCIRNCKHRKLFNQKFTCEKFNNNSVKIILKIRRSDLVFGEKPKKVTPNEYMETYKYSKCDEKK